MKIKNIIESLQSLNDPERDIRAFTDKSIEIGPEVFLDERGKLWSTNCPAPKGDPIPLINSFFNYMSQPLDILGTQETLERLERIEKKLDSQNK